MLTDRGRKDKLFEVLNSKGAVMTGDQKALNHAARRTHEAAIKLHLSGGQVDKVNLWLAVGYFHEGAGASLEKPCCQHAWADLLRITGRSPQATADSLCGNFRRC